MPTFDSFLLVSSAFVAYSGPLASAYRQSDYSMARLVRSLCLLISVVCCITLCPAQKSGSVVATRNSDTLSLSNDAIAVKWLVQKDGLRLQSVTNHFTGVTLTINNSAFALVSKEGPVLRSPDFEIAGQPVIEDIPNSPASPRAADRVPGRQIRVELQDAAAHVHVTWKALLREHANYVQQAVTIQALERPLALAQIILVDAVIPDAAVSGHAKGSPISAGTWFAGFEHPLSECRVRYDRASCWLSRELPINAGQSVTYSSVYGVAHQNQLRRDFLNYVELERAHPYRTFLHYNSWYDLGRGERYSEQQAIDSIRQLGDQLTRQRSVKLDSFLFDDGWDDPATLWKFNAALPDGLKKIHEVAASYGAAPGIWFSPWGGYEQAKDRRLAAARDRGFETVEGGFALSGSKYYRYFRDACLEMIDKYGVNHFKFDGTGNANQVIPGSEFDSDFDAAIHLIGELRAKKPDIYINLTTGTYPSPFWLLYADSIWRGGDDHSFAGVGSDRQRWITYRDAQTYRHVVEEGLLFPLNSLMLHGMIYARQAERLGSDPGHDFADEVHSYFGTGTQLQEMYITPSLLSSQDWDVLAESAKWARANADVLKDSHWIGGDPARLEVYGWAAWSPKKSIITLRNPSDKPQEFSAKPLAMLELPAGNVSSLAARAVFGTEVKPFPLSAQETHVFHLQPFEVLTVEVQPK